MEPIDPVAGHIPGAANVSFSSVAPGGRYLPPGELRELLDPGSDRELVAYCGSGVTATSLVLAAEVAGLDARLYPGSWSEWCARGLPAAVNG
jgi:thiosulfate/3-mercaptopyruvate sulfurtransferase